MINYDQPMLQSNCAIMAIMAIMAITAMLIANPCGRVSY